MNQFAIDRITIENKYHLADQSFDPYKRMAYHGYDYPEATGLSDEAICQGLDALAPQLRELPHPVARARAIQYVLEHTRIDVNAHDWFVGFYSVNRLAGRITCDPWSQEVFTKRIPQTQQLMDDMNTSKAVAIWPDYDHVIPDWKAIMELGFPGLRQRARNYKAMHEAQGTLTAETAAFFEGIEIEYTAILDVLDRLYQWALIQNHAKAKGIAQCIKQLKEGAPTNIYEAMQLIYIYFMVSECFDSYQVRSLGNGLDQTLLPFYEHDLQKGTYTREAIRELLAYFLLQWSAIGNYWGQPFYMGGTWEDGSTKYNALSYDILDVYDNMDIYNPKIQIKVNRNTPDALLRKVFDMIRRGHSCFVFCCEPGMIQAVMSYGATYEEALHMDIRGCYETGVRADEVSTGTGYVNALKAVEYVFTNGFDRILQKPFGIATGALDAFPSFADFYHAVLAQWGNLVERVIEAADAYEPYLSEVNPSSMYSATIQRSLEKGVDAYQKGVRFNNSAILNCGMASLVDAVMAVKHLVYDTHTVTLEELKTALDANWMGHEALRVKALKCPHKYGNGDSVADTYTQAMGAYFSRKVGNRPNARGGVYKAIMHSAMQFVWQGEGTPATPDGRKAGDEISKNASPTSGMDKNGVTALIRSALSLKPFTYPESFCLDILLHPSAVAGEEGLTAMKGLLMAYLEGGGMSIQFNVFHTDTLRDAQIHPEKYKNLQVRVCGWNALWNNLSEKEQNAYILRSENVQM